MKYLLDVFCPAEPLKNDDEVRIIGSDKVFVIDIIVNGLALLKSAKNGTFKIAEWELVKDLQHV